MRRILVERARRKRRAKHGGDRRCVELEVAFDLPEPRDDLPELDEALGRLAAIDPVAARLVELRYFAGLTAAEAAQALGVSVRTAKPNWTCVMSWLPREVAGGQGGDTHDVPG